MRFIAINQDGLLNAGSQALPKLASGACTPEFRHIYYYALVLLVILMQQLKTKLACKYFSNYKDAQFT
jgi:hypothetical protein